MKRILIVLFVALLCGAPVFGEDAASKAYLIDEAEELRLAATAAPEQITKDATYYVLGMEGFAKVKDGSNGFHCFVERSWSAPKPNNKRGFDPRVKAPNCINAEGARTTMKEIFMVSKLAMAGHSGEEIDDVVNRAYDDGELTLPTGLSMTYMMSKHQYLHEKVGAWKPHLMLWIPYLTVEQVGFQFSDNVRIQGKPGSRRSVLIVPVPDFIE